MSIAASTVLILITTLEAEHTEVLPQFDIPVFHGAAEPQPKFCVFGVLCGLNCG